MSTEVNVLIPEDTASCCGPSCCDDTAAEAAAPAVEARAETPLTAAAIKATVREKYAQIAVGAASSCCDSSVCCTDDISMIGDAYDTVEGYVAEADLGLGCGLPTEYANLQAGQTVLDLGAGAGLDAFVARRIVGDEGRVLGLDMTQEMVDKARANVRTLGYDNVDFYLGDIEAMPFDEGTVDVVISNCVLNLVPEQVQERIEQKFEAEREHSEALEYDLSQVLTPAQLEVFRRLPELERSVSGPPVVSEADFGPDR